MHGKPALVEDGVTRADLRFNLSHSGDYCVCAVALGREVGIDVEAVRPDVECLQLADRFFTKREWEDLRTTPEQRRYERFFRYWTCKEACLKAQGIGISSGLAGFEVIFEPDGSARCGTVKRGTASRPGCLVRPITIAPDVAAAVAAEGDGWKMTVARYSPP
jgi:4'-phosphopantetheinyl transferase